MCVGGGMRACMYRISVGSGLCVSGKYCDVEAACLTGLQAPEKQLSSCLGQTGLADF